MKINLQILNPYKSLIGKDKLVWDFEGGDIEKLLNELSEKYPKFGNDLRTGGDIYLSIFVNDKPMSALDGDKTQLKDGDELLLFFAIAGG